MRTLPILLAEIFNGRRITLDHLPKELIQSKNTEIPANDTEQSGIDPESILNALKKTHWNKAKVARMFGISRPTLYKKIKEYKLNDPGA